MSGELFTIERQECYREMLAEKSDAQLDDEWDNLLMREEISAWELGQRLDLLIAEMRRRTERRLNP